MKRKIERTEKLNEPENKITQKNKINKKTK